MNDIKATNVFFYDQKPVQASLYDEVTSGLSRKPRTIPPKFFYDEQGSKLFDAICKTPEYYLTRAEKSIIEQNLTEITKLIGPGCLLIEPGSGSCQKIRGLLDSVNPHAYMPMDISGEYLRSVAEDIADDFPELNVHAVCTDYTQPLALPYNPPRTRKIAFFPGSSIGNFNPEQASSFLSRIAHLVEADGGILIGVDMKKEPDILNAAYNDAEGVTAAFNLNLLSHINRELGADFNLNNFHHRAFYNDDMGRIEMHLVSDCAQTVNINSIQFEFAEGETIHTENSYKYHLEEFQDLAIRAGFTPVKTWTDPDQLFSFNFLTADSDQIGFRNLF